MQCSTYPSIRPVRNARHVRLFLFPALGRVVPLTMAPSEKEKTRGLKRYEPYDDNARKSKVAKKDGEVEEAPATSNTASDPVPGGSRGPEPASAVSVSSAGLPTRAVG